MVLYLNKRIIPLASALSCWLVLVSAPLAGSAAAIEYPPAKRSTVSDNYHGQIVEDPYRWLEDGSSAETRTWLSQQDRLTKNYFAGLKRRAAIQQRLKQLWTYKSHGVPEECGGLYFYTIDDGVKKLPILYKATSMDAKPEVLIDPNLFSPDGSKSLGNYQISNDGRLVAYGIVTGGSDWEEWRIREVKSGKDLPDLLRGIKWNSPVWNRQATGLFYSHYPDTSHSENASGENEKVYFHPLGGNQNDDVLVFSPAEPKWMTFATVSEDGQWLLLHVYKSSDAKTDIHVADISQLNWSEPQALRKLKFKPSFGGFKASMSFLGNERSKGWFKTWHDAPNGRVIALNLEKPSLKRAEETIPEGRTTLDGVGLVGRRFIVITLIDGTNQVTTYDLNGKALNKIKLPAIGSVTGFGGKLSDDQTFFAFSNYYTPKSIYRYDFKTGDTQLLFRPHVLFRSDDFITHQVFYISNDGTYVPMFVTHKKAINFNGKNPVWLYAYGAYGNTETPWFISPKIVWMEQGGIFAVANIRGGGVYGANWHAAGSRENKQHSFDDYIAAAQWLVDNGYTSPKYLVANGGSLGGLLVGASMIQRPDLFAAVIDDVGLLDALRYHKFTGAYLWIDELGSSDDPDQFKILRSYSPLHNVVPKTNYPAVLITTGLQDTRMIPGHSYKFAAALQAASSSKKPILLRVEPKGGHDSSMLPKNRRIELETDKLSFALDAVKRQ